MINPAMLMLLKKKMGAPDGSASDAPDAGSAGPGEDEVDPGLVDAAQDVLDAINSNDAHALAGALSDFTSIGSNPDSSAPEAPEAQPEEE